MVTKTKVKARARPDTRARPVKALPAAPKGWESFDRSAQEDSPERAQRLTDKALKAWATRRAQGWTHPRARTDSTPRTPILCDRCRAEIQPRAELPNVA